MRPLTVDKSYGIVYHSFDFVRGNEVRMRPCFDQETGLLVHLRAIFTGVFLCADPEGTALHTVGGRQ